jgi:hypothetical protein
MAYPQDYGMSNLADTAFASLQAFNAAHGHSPDEKHIKALRAIPDTLSAMAEGKAANRVYLSALDPGVGKSQATAHFARALVHSPDHREVGMLIMVGRIDEASGIARTLQDVRENLAVFTSDDKVNALGGTGKDAQSSAQILITTHQRAERLIREHRTFSSIEAFHFRGQPRAVRVWDEAYLPGVPISQDRTALLGLVRPLLIPYRKLADVIETFATQLRDVANDQLICVPDFEAEAGASFIEVVNNVDLSDEQLSSLMGLYAVGGTNVRAASDDKMGVSLVSFEDVWPTDFRPVLVLDASGRVRTTYSDMEKYRGTIERLPTAVKRYEPLTIHAWKTQGGKHAFHDRKKREYLLDGIVELIQTKPDEKWLIVAHKDAKGSSPTIDALRKRLPSISVGGPTPEGSDENPVDDEEATVRVITWGNHMAVNAYRDFPNVILAGTLFMRDSSYIAMTHLSQGRPTRDGFRPRSEIMATQKGEHAHFLLQALCRGRVRQLDGEYCKPMDAYIIASERSGVIQQLPEIFPGCTMKTWREEPKAIPKQVRIAVAYLRAMMAEGVMRITYETLAAVVKVSRQNLARDVLSHPEWKAAAQALGWNTSGKGRQARMLYRLV